MSKASATLASAMLVASAANYLLNVFLARWLLPDEFGDANLMVTLMLATSAVAAALQLLTARRISTADAETAKATRRISLRRAWMIGGGIGFLAISGAPALRDVTSSASALPFVILGIGIPFYLTQAVERGVLQGELRFKRLALTFMVEAATRLGATLGAVTLGFGVVGATTGLSVSFVASWLAARPSRAARAGTSATVTRAAEDGAARRAATATSILLVAQIIINNGDVVLAKVLFDAEAAGIYAVVALVGRGVFFLSWSIVMAAFPMAARDGGRQVVRQAVVGVAGVSAVATTVVAVVMPHATAIVFGTEYSSASGEFGRYAIATSMFAVANVIATLELASGRGRTAAVVLTGAFAQTAILMFASSTRAMVDIQIVTMSIVAAAVIGVFIFGTKETESPVCPSPQTAV
ncbi:MAG: O-antigen/teichoic acid export membrane protein [Acidimicrobiales bacterium]|jgi:O-antigen/teichoic acid export membrane protein